MPIKKILVAVLAVLSGVCMMMLFSAYIALAQDAPVERTGQTTCYDTLGNVISCAGTGQDGDLQRGVAWPNPRFTDNGDGTVTDNLTGLMWAKDADLFDGVGKNWADAITAAENLVLGTKGCGSYTDWRLPNARELMSLVDYENGQDMDKPDDWPALPSGHPFTDVQTYYWTSSTMLVTEHETQTYDTSWAWRLMLFSGKMVVTYKFITAMVPGEPSGHLAVWPVRGETDLALPAPVEKTGQTVCYDPSCLSSPPPCNIVNCTGTGQDGEYQKGVAWPNPRFTDHGDGTVTDNLTGLMWTQDAQEVPGPMVWADALTACDTLSLGQKGCGEYSDWRCPNIKELQSLSMDLSQTGPPLPSGHPFTNVQQFYWSSTTAAARNPALAWRISMKSGRTMYIGKDASTTHYLWCVRGGD